MVNREELRLLCKRLNLHHLSKIDTFDLEIKDKLNYFKYLLEYELSEREKKVKRQNKISSHLPVFKNNINFTGIDKWNIDDALKLEFMHDGYDQLLIGKCGKGKTYAATLIGNEAIDKGYKVYYLKIDEYLTILKNTNGQKEKLAYSRMKDADLIILDEMNVSTNRGRRYYASI